MEFSQHAEYAGFIALKPSASTYWCLQESPTVLGWLLHVNKHISSPFHHTVQSTREVSHGVAEAECAAQRYRTLLYAQACRGGPPLGDPAEDCAMQLHL